MITFLTKKQLSQLIYSNKELENRITKIEDKAKDLEEELRQTRELLKAITGR